MDPKAILAWLAQQLGLSSADDAEAGDVAEQGEDGADIREGDAPTDDAENIPADGSDADGSADDGTGGEPDADGETEDGETIPDSDAELATLRDAATTLATENERLRTILTDNGIDFEGEPEIEAAVESADTEDADDAEHDDEKAQADIDAIKSRNAAWDK